MWTSNAITFPQPQRTGESGFARYRSPWRDRDGGGDQLLHLLKTEVYSRFEWVHVLKLSCTSTKFMYVHVGCDVVELGLKKVRRGQRAVLVFDFLDLVLYFDLVRFVHPVWRKCVTVAFPICEMSKCKQRALET